jgi:hypothetical protein
MATEQAGYALAAYARLKAGQPRLYDMSDAFPAPLVTDAERTEELEKLGAAAQGANTLKSLKASRGKLAPEFAPQTRSYKLALKRGQASAKLTFKRFDAGAVVKVKVGKGAWKKAGSVTVRLDRGKKTTVQIKVSKKGVKAAVYKVVVSRAK